MKNVQRFAGAPRGLYRSQDLFADLQVRAVYFNTLAKINESFLARDVVFEGGSPLSPSELASLKSALNQGSEESMEDGLLLSPGASKNPFISMSGEEEESEASYSTMDTGLQKRNDAIQTLGDLTVRRLATSLQHYSGYDIETCFEHASELLKTAQDAAAAANNDPENKTIEDILNDPERNKADRDKLAEYLSIAERMLSTQNTQ
jgi:hypothetical protein